MGSSRVGLTPDEFVRLPQEQQASALAEWREKPASPEILTLLIQIGHAHYLRRDLSAAIVWEEEALSMARQLHDTETESHLVSNLAEFSLDIEDYRRAVHYLYRLLPQVRASGDRAAYAYDLLKLAAAYTESGEPERALGLLDEAELELRAATTVTAAQTAYCWSVRGQALLDLKRHEEAKPLFDAAEAELHSDLLRERLAQCVTEAGSPLRLDCPHRILQMAATGSSNGVSHRNPQPVIRINDPNIVTADLTTEERHRFREFWSELQRDSLQVQWSSSGSATVPDQFLLPLRMEYVDDVAAFEVKWAAFKQEQRHARLRDQLQAAWDNRKDQFRHRGDSAFEEEERLELLAYVQRLTEIAQACADIRDLDQFLPVARHLADLLEVGTDDPFLAALFWILRADFMVSLYSVAHPGSKALVAIEVRRSLDRATSIFSELDRDQQIFVMEATGCETWYRAATSVLGPYGYAGLAKTSRDVAAALSDTKQLPVAVALGESGDSVGCVEMIERLWREKQAARPNDWVWLVPEFGTALAVHRFKALCVDYAACERRYGPFAEHIHAEIAHLCDDLFPASSPVRMATPGRNHVHAFVDGNLVVMSKRLADGGPYAAALKHEVDHAVFRAGQMLLTDTGQWLRRKRDVPVASAKTYLYQVKAAAMGTPLDLDPAVVSLIEKGRQAVTADRDGTDTHVRHMLRHFDDLGQQETPASYACAAVLVGVTQGLFGAAAWSEAEAYLSHLFVMDHDDAVEHARRRAVLRTSDGLTTSERSASARAALESGQSLAIPKPLEPMDARLEAAVEARYREQQLRIDLEQWHKRPWWQRLFVKPPGLPH